MNNTYLENTLLHLGFTRSEALIYITLLRHGVLKAADIITKTNLQRSVVYTALKNLVHRKLIIEENTKVSRYRALDTQRIIDIQRESLLEAELLVTKLNRERIDTEKNAFVYEGLDIVTTVAEKSLAAEQGSTVYFFGSSKFGVQDNLEDFWQKYHETRESKRINAQILYDRFVPEKIVQQRNTYKTCTARYLPLHIEVPISFVIWDSHIAILIPGEKPPIVFFINNQATADTLIEYFKYMWKMSSTKNSL